jgi:hypothetical protein
MVKWDAVQDLTSARQTQEKTMRKLSKKTLAVATTVVLLSGGGAAYAYWTTTGTGIGTATTGTSTAITANQTSTIGNLRPGGTPQVLAGNFTNPVVNGPQYVTSVTVSIASVTKATGAPAGTCAEADYVLVPATGVMTVGAEVPASATTSGTWGGAGSGSAAGVTIAFVNTVANQDACKGATVNLQYAVN